jgi:hypothetical protein
VKVGFETADEVADSTTEETDDAASVAASLTSSTTSARAAVAAKAASAIEVKRIVAQVRRRPARCNLQLIKEDNIGEV